MKRTPLLLTTLMYLAPLLLCGNVDADEEPKPVRPKTEGRPVFLAAGKIVVFPEGVGEAPKDYRGSINVRPLALIKVKDQIVGEVFAASLKGSAVDEANEMVTSAAKNNKIDLLKRATTKNGKDHVEIVTLRMNLKSNVGTPWVLHSLYFPREKSTTTFKLVTSEKQFKSVLPYFETMLFLGQNDPKRK